MTCDSEVSQLKEEIRVVHAENVRLLRELESMKFILSSSKIQTGQMKLLKEAAEERFEQLVITGDCG